ncbi:MAG: trimethylamine methyltransferase, partial [Rhodobacteraceae bacterium]|nr:trimethylamine methyltransferase [Paracoccaceae bacterium]
MISHGYGLSEDEFRGGIWSSTVINSNSPRLLDDSMVLGLMDYARYGQLTIMTPFCLSGAMAPITVEGALVLSHAEALAGITLSQMTNPGAPIAYGSFSSNVDMKSGSPAFGTPEHVRLQIGAGQLARLIGIPWRAAAGSASNASDAQGAAENLMGLWGAVMAGANIILHSVGWLEGGLTVGYEKTITDLEQIQSIAELCLPGEDTDLAAVFADIASVAPGGHFFDTDVTMARFAEAFYPPLVADLSNHGAWQEAGGLTAEE